MRIHERPLRRALSVALVCLLGLAAPACVTEQDGGGGGGDDPTSTGRNTGSETDDPEDDPKYDPDADPTRAGCEAMQADCDGDKANGCEVDLSRDEADCGRCGRACTGTVGGEARCKDGRCIMACDDGLGDCDERQANGCEVDIQTSAEHCGACFKDCGGSRCVAGACACATGSVQGESAPLDLLFLIDRSGSMLRPLSALTSELSLESAEEVHRWAAVRGAVKSFFRDERAVGLSAAMAVFPPASADDCAAASYDPSAGGYSGIPLAEVVEVPGSSRGDETRYLTYLDGAPAQSGQGTPTYGALPPMLSYAMSLARDPARADRKVAVVLVTDGEPQGCSSVDLAAKVREARAAGVNTYVVGVGRSGDGLKNIRALAEEGSDALDAFSVDGTGAYLTAPFDQPAVGAAVQVAVNDNGNLEEGMPVWIAEAGAGYIVEKLSPLTLRRTGRDGVPAQARVSAAPFAASAPVGDWVSATGTAKDTAKALERPLVATTTADFVQPAAGAKVTLKLDSRMLALVGMNLYIAGADTLYRVDGRDSANAKAITVTRLSSGGIAAGASVAAGATVHDATVVLDPVLPILTSVSGTLGCPRLVTPTLTIAANSISVAATLGCANNKGYSVTLPDNSGVTYCEVTRADEPPGAHCPLGGVKLTGRAPGAAAATTSYLCADYVSTADTQPVARAGLTLGGSASSAEASAAGCAEGALIVNVAERGVTTKQYVCKKGSESSSSLSTRPVYPGDECPLGGLQADVKTSVETRRVGACHRLKTLTDAVATVGAVGRIKAGDELYVDECRAAYTVKAVDGAGQKLTLAFAESFAPVTASGSNPRIYRGNPRLPPQLKGGAEALAEALQVIRGNLIGCSFAVPESDKEIDYDRVNLELTLDGDVRPIGYAESLEKCTASEGGWYYRSTGQGDARELVLCPSTCDELTSARSTAVSIQLGCVTRATQNRG